MTDLNSLIIRREKPEDLSDIFRVNKEAFGRENEAALVDELRCHDALVLSLVAVRNGILCGHIAFNPVVVEGCSGCNGIALAPLAVLPASQRQGIGTRLIEVGLEECRRLGYQFVVLVGHPAYYPRFGFIQAKSQGLQCQYEAPDDAWMVLELQKGALTGKQGTVIFRPEFAAAV
jgi:putative acetyltransferase